MVGRIRSRGLTLVKLAVLVAVLVFVFLAAIAWAARMRIHSWRMSCAANLATLGKAMLIYSPDYEETFPRAGGPGSQWTGRVADWKAANRRQAYGLSQDGSDGQVSVSASLYLLVKYVKLPTRTLLCGETKWGTRERGITEFRVDTYPVPRKDVELIDLWDFGPDPTRHVSYAYHMPYGPYKIELAPDSDLVAAADRNPWMDSPATGAKSFAGFQPDIPPFNGTAEQARHGNTIRHQEEGQNVLFLDAHVEFRNRSFCGLDCDNIYTSRDGRDKARGVPPKLGSVPADANDSLLVNDPISPSR